MANIGLDCLYFAPIEEDESCNEYYGRPEKLAKAITANITVNTTETQLTADGECVERVLMFADGKIALAIDELGSYAAAALLGAKVDENGVIISSKEDTPKPVAVGFRSRKSDGTYKYVWLYRVLFSIPGSDAATSGNSITYTTPHIEGGISRRNRPDYNGDHPWKAELNEDDRHQSILAQAANSMLAQANGEPQSILSLNNRSMEVSEKLSTGYRLNRASDDDAGRELLRRGWFEYVYEPGDIESRIRDTDMTSK